MMEKASKAKSSEKITVNQDSQVQQKCKIEHPEDERDVQAGVAEVRSKGNADEMSKAGTKEEIRKDVPFSKDIYQPETKMRYKLSSVEHKFLDKEEKENESVALESLTPELVKNISPPGSKLCGVDELKLELRSRGLPVSGTKKELVDRLREDDNKEGISSFGIDWEELPLLTDDCVVPNDVETSCAFSEMEIYNQSTLTV